MKDVKRVILIVSLVCTRVLAYSQSFPWYSLGIPITPSSEPTSEDARSENATTPDSERKTVQAEERLLEKSDNPLVNGLESYRNKDWVSSTIFLRRALSENKDAGAEVLFMLIMSEMYNGDYDSAVRDCDSFLSLYPASSLVRNVQYQKGRALHCTGQNDQSVLVLSDFCHQNPTSRMYPSALYWIAECFYDDYNFDTARGLYEQIVSDYPEDKKAVDAKFKLDAISQREREQKLLMLLKETDEEYMSSREAYERQLREYESQDVAALRKQLNEANSRIAELEKGKLEESGVEKVSAAPAVVTVPGKDGTVAEQLVTENAAFVQPSEASKKRKGISSNELLNLKIRAAQLQRLLDEKYCTSADGEGEFHE